MIVHVGKRIRVESGRFRFECDCATPGAVHVSSDRGDIVLPGNEQEALRFVAAYLRAVREPIDYVSGEVESGNAPVVSLLQNPARSCSRCNGVGCHDCAPPEHR
jgi:ribosomal protein L6P/L9E